MASALPVIYVLIVFVVLTVGAAFGIPKYLFPREDKGVVLTMIITTSVCLYLMWAVCYLAQVNPLIKPRRTNYPPISEH